jgi:hypothetical protein
MSGTEISTEDSVRLKEILAEVAALQPEMDRINQAILGTVGDLRGLPAEIWSTRSVLAENRKRLYAEADSILGIGK